MKKLVIIGGGHAHVEVLRQFGLNRLRDVNRDVDVTLVSPDRYTPYSGMLPGLVAGHYTFEQCHIDLQRLAQYAGAQFRLTSARSMDTARQRVQLDEGSELDYDVASFDVGSVLAAQDVAGVAAHAITLRPVRDFLAAWEALQARARAGALRTVAVVGGGAGGVEVLLAMQHRLAQINLRTAPEYVLITDAPQLMPQHARGVRHELERRLARKRVTLYRGLRVTRVEADALITRDAQQREQRIGTEAVVWVTGAAPPGWLADTGLELNDKKFININKYLQSTSHANVFAAGDCATIEGMQYPKSGVYAVRQAPVLAANLRHGLGGTALAAYTPQKRALALISTGERHAIASWGALSFHGNWVWRWKNRIDQAFMSRYRNLA